MGKRPRVWKVTIDDPDERQSHTVWVISRTSQGAQRAAARLVILLDLNGALRTAGRGTSLLWRLREAADMEVVRCVAMYAVVVGESGF